MQEGGPLPGYESELLSNSCLTLGEELSKEVHMLTKQETLLGKGASAEGSRVRGPKRTPVSGFMVIGLVSRLSSANHSDPESFLVLHALLSLDGCHQKGFWEVVVHVLSLFDFF